MIAFFQAKQIHAEFVSLEAVWWSQKDCPASQLILSIGRQFWHKIFTNITNLWILLMLHFSLITKMCFFSQILKELCWACLQACSTSAYSLLYGCHNTLEWRRPIGLICLPFYVAPPAYMTWTLWSIKIIIEYVVIYQSGSCFFNLLIHVQSNSVFDLKGAVKIYSF